MSEIAQVFERCREQKRAAFIPFLVAGHPTLELSGAVLEAMAAGGADIIEVGVPFSDPVADGPVIQAASAKALAGGASLPAVLDLISRYRDRIDVPIVLFSYFNPIHARGIDRFAEQAAASGVDGVLCVDLPVEEGSRSLAPALTQHGIDSIYLLAPTSTKDRIAEVAQQSAGFVYYVSRTGVTGERAALTATLSKEVKRLRRRLELPVAVGFGISSPAQAKEVGRFADGVVVGSALVRLIDDQADDVELPARVEERVRELVAPLSQPTRRKLFG